MGEWVTVGDLVAVNEAAAFAGELTLPNGEVRIFKEIEVPCEGGTDFAWERVA